VLRFLSGIRPDERRRWRDTKPIEHLILDDSISEGADRVSIEKQGFIQQVPGVSLGEKALMVAVKNIARRAPFIRHGSFALDRHVFGLAAPYRATCSWWRYLCRIQWLLVFH